jgi:hypothetical protein
MLGETCPQQEDGVERMKKWILPLTVFGMGSLGVLALSDKGLEVIRWGVQRLTEAPGRFVEWNEAAQHELDRLQNAINEMAATLEAIQ